MERDKMKRTVDVDVDINKFKLSSTNCKIALSQIKIN